MTPKDFYESFLTSKEELVAVWKHEPPTSQDVYFYMQMKVDQSISNNVHRGITHLSNKLDFINEHLTNVDGNIQKEQRARFIKLNEELTKSVNELKELFTPTGSPL